MHSTHLLCATTLRTALGTKYLAEILSERFVITKLSTYHLQPTHQGADSPLDGKDAG